MSFLFRLVQFHDLIGGIHVPVDDGVDKLNRKYTLLVFLFLALPIFTKQYIGDPIECFTPTYFTEPQARYVNSYCWTASTYYLVAADADDEDYDIVGQVGKNQDPPDPRVLPEELDYGGFDVASTGPERLRRVRVGYYQWAPLILLVQGCCFYVPFLVYNSCAHNAGVKLRRLLKKASDIASLPPGCQQREALLAEFVDQFHTLVTGEAGWCTDPSCRLPLSCRCCSGGPSRYLCLLYLLVKSLYVLNVGLQFLLLGSFMGRGFLRHGLELIRRLMVEGEWWASPRFPLQTLCQVRAAIQGGLRTYTCQCVLPINVFNEKIFSVVWFYMAFLLPLNVLSLLFWVWRSFRCNRLAYIRLCLWRTRLVSMAEVGRLARKISGQYLGWDGVFVLRLIEHNHGSIMATLIVSRLWEFYANQMKMQEEGNTGSDAEMGSVASVGAPPSTSWHSCHPTACHVTGHHHFSGANASGPQGTISHSNKRMPPNGFWGI
ncbi:innexin unc-9-like isoform X1 [Tetranychus urticae]|uniref:innexin unc-9-like isoform X1 n=1 Tax=Tetranychus urticae TaxID=32264 RepID=UPI00077BB525|nr:innexin unc-9-like isoform X1 [Tetranychus urticae]XP_015795104.1 innexin unc-9-like isoform X1 [Tetranychus urticae]